MADKWRSSATQRIIRLPQSSPDLEVQMDNHKFSRSGAAAQSEFESCAAPLCRRVKIVLTSLIVLLVCTAAFAQNKPARFDPDGSFWVLGDLPNEFSEFSEINLNAKRSRRLSVQGFVVGSGKRLAFKTLTV